MKKQDCVKRYFEIFNKEVKDLQIDERLQKLMEEDRVTAGAAYYIYSSHSWHSGKTLGEIIGKALNSKNYTRAIKRTDSWTWNYYIKQLEEDLKKTVAFIEEQENLPFEQTQMQILKAEGKLNK